MATVAEILEKKGRFVATVGRKAAVLEAAREMNARRVGALVVVDEQKVVGIVSERDVLIRVVAAQRDPTTTLVEEVMTAPVACCRANTPLAECESLMTVKRIRHLPVVEENELIGIVTIGDLMAREVVDHKAVIGYLHEYIHGPYVNVSMTPQDEQQSEAVHSEPEGTT